jgi:hypothetical protein
LLFSADAAFLLDPASRQGFALRRGDACIQTAAKR